MYSLQKGRCDQKTDKEEKGLNFNESCAITPIAPPSPPPPFRQAWSLLDIEVLLETPNCHKPICSTETSISMMTAPNLRSCRGRAVRALNFHTGGPRFELRPGSSALGQGALSSLPSLSEETKPSVPCIGEKYLMHVKETHFISRKE